MLNNIFECFQTQCWDKLTDEELIDIIELLNESDGHSWININREYERRFGKKYENDDISDQRWKEMTSKNKLIQ